MTLLEPTTLNAAKLVYKGLQPKLVPAVDTEYRALINLYEARAPFRRMVEDVALGLDLEVLEVSPDGAFFVPASSESRFAQRLIDIRAVGLSPVDKAQMVLVHTAIAAMFFPDADNLNDDAFNPVPVSESATLTSLKNLCLYYQRLSDRGAVNLPKELEPGWKGLIDMPETRPEAGRRSRTALDGLIASCFRTLQEAGFVRLDSEDPSPRYTATRRFAAHLRGRTVSALFGIARAARAHEADRA